MLNKLKNILSFFLPLSRREFGLCMNEVTVVLDGMVEESAQQAEVITNLMAKIGEMNAKKSKEEEKPLEDDPAFN